jgi:glycosyltransferase involved in cell wall biosynthesis
MAARSDRIEVLIADNASTDGTRGFVESVRDPRIRYVNSGTRLSMSANWEFAVQHAVGDYIMIIGDDDAIVPGALDRLISDVATHASDVYFWPKHMYVWPTTGRNAYVETLAPQTQAAPLDLGRLSRFVLRMGGWRYALLPSMYHSLVARRIPDAMRHRFGRVYHTSEPDVFMMMSIPVFTPTAWNVGYSVTVHGRSPKSNGWAFTVKEEPKGLLRFLSEYGEYDLHPTLYPEVPKLANLTADTLLRARDMYNDYYKNYPFGYEAMWAYMCREAAVFNFHLSPLVVLRDRQRIRRYHPLRVERFLAFLAFQMAVETRARLRRRTQTAQRAPDTILEFVNGLGASGARLKPTST